MRGKKNRQPEQLALPLEMNRDGIVKRNAIIQSPSGQRRIKVNATAEVLEIWRRAGWKARWLEQDE